MKRGFRTRAVGRALLATVAALVIAPTAADASQPVFEPNDTLATAAGPLGVGLTYEGALETSNDVDYFYFYVVAPTTAQVRFTFKNLGGSPHDEWVSAAITDSHGSTIDRMEEVRAGDYDDSSITLTPGKYFFKVYWGDGEGYSFTTAGTDGAFGPYATIQANCAAAQTAVNSAQEAVGAAASKVARAEERSRRAWAHLHRVERHGTYGAKRKARRKAGRAKAALRAAMAMLKEAEKTYKGATKLESPWCFIPQ